MSNLTPSITNLFETAPFQRNGENVYVSKSKVDGRTVAAMERRDLIVYGSYYSWKLTPNGIVALDEVTGSNHAAEIQQLTQEKADERERKVEALKELAAGTQVTIHPRYHAGGLDTEAEAQPWKASFSHFDGTEVVIIDNARTRNVEVEAISFEGFASTDRRI